MAVLVDRGEEPGDVKAVRQVDEARAPRHEYELTGPDRLEVGPRQQHRARLQRMLRHDLVVTRLAEQEKAAVAQKRDAGQRRIGKAVPFGADPARS